MEPILGINEGTSAAVIHTPRRARHSNSASPEPDLGVNDDFSAVPDHEIVPELEALPVPEFPQAPASFSFSRRR